VVGEEQRAPGPGGRERCCRGGVGGGVAAGEDEAVTRVVDVPAEAAVAVAGEGDRVRHRVLAGNALHAWRDLADFANDGGGDRRGGAEHVDRHLRVPLQRRRGGCRQLVRLGVEDRIARTGRPGGSGHREVGLGAGGDDDVLWGGPEETIAQGGDLSRGGGGFAGVDRGRLAG